MSATEIVIDHIEKGLFFMHDYVVEFTHAINEILKDYSPVQLILSAVVSFLIFQRYYTVFTDLKKEGIVAAIFRIALRLPCFSGFA